MPSLGKVKVGDIVVFNYPDAYDRHKIEFRINYVYTKRCIGLPGDTVGIYGGRYSNSSFPRMKMVPAEEEDVLVNTPDSIIALKKNIYRAFPIKGGLRWTIRNLGPMLVPEKGSTISLDNSQVYIYARAIEYETGYRPKISDGRVFIGGKEADSYTFTHNYYFLGGDNVLNSKDSRYFGVVPEEYIIGVATRILFSRDPCTGKLIKKRTLKKLSKPDAY
jgi:signal peptidase I